MYITCTLSLWYFTNGHCHSLSHICKMGVETSYATGAAARWKDQRKNRWHDSYDHTVVMLQGQADIFIFLFFFLLTAQMSRSHNTQHNTRRNKINIKIICEKCGNNRSVISLLAHLRYALGLNPSSLALSSLISRQAEAPSVCIVIIIRKCDTNKMKVLKGDCIVNNRFQKTRGSGTPHHHTLPSSTSLDEQAHVCNLKKNQGEIHQSMHV